ncbi:unnamed protein product [Miscanthus lutarioriparius]|uniref:Uncharacterized protein n=1 Tax=Miscanthus lutarioriparius TaxID=422564 RepID=A0A811NJE6_9POAL|nr:unnamed protein product [Miscanthus lutarioriparius]
MGISRTEVNLLRLLDSAPRQRNQAKLIHYITTSQGLLEQLAAETTEGMSSVSKAKLNEYSDKIEELAAMLAPEVPDDAKAVNEIKGHSPKGHDVGSPTVLSSGLRRRLIGSQVEAEQIVSEKERDAGAPIRLDAAAQARIDKHRLLQEGLIDEMVELAHQLNKSSLIMNRSMQEMEKLVMTDFVSSQEQHPHCGNKLALYPLSKFRYSIQQRQLWSIAWQAAAMLMLVPWSMPMLLAGAASEGDLRPRLLR